MVSDPIGQDVDKLYRNFEKDIDEYDDLVSGIIEDTLIRVKFSQDNDLSQLTVLQSYVDTQEKKPRGKK